MFFPSNSTSPSSCTNLKDLLMISTMSSAVQTDHNRGKHYCAMCKYGASKMARLSAHRNNNHCSYGEENERINSNVAQKLYRMTIFRTYLVGLVVLAWVKLYFCSKRSEEAEKVATYLSQAHHSDPRPPIILIPGIIASRMISWRQKKCAGPGINVQDVVWLNLQKLVETMTYDKNCWLDCMKLDADSTDPVDCKIRPDEGLDSVGELSPGLYRPSGTSIFTSLIHTLAKDLGYDSNSLLAAPYDWRLSPMELEKRDSYFTALKFKIEMAVQRHQRPVILLSHSMGYHIFTYFTSWLKAISPPSIGYDAWVYKHIYTVVAIAAPLLGTPSSLKAIMSGHTFSLPLSPIQARELMLTFSVTHYLNPRVDRSGWGLEENGWGGFPPLVTLRGQEGRQVTFNMSDIESGSFFATVGDIYNDSLLKSKQEVHRSRYLTDPLTP
ncbi:hypothetical protein EON65_55960, partial [archaeon]